MTGFLQSDPERRSAEMMIPLWVSTTHRVWRALVLYTFLVASGTLMVMAIWTERSHLRLATAASFGMFLIWLRFAFACPACGVQVGWWCVSRNSVLTWFTSFTQLQRCPACGDDGLNDTTSRPKR